MFSTLKPKSFFLLKNKQLIYKPLNKRFISFDNAKKQILTHELISKDLKNLKEINTDEISTLAELFYTVVDPSLSKISKLEQLELFTFLLKQTASVEFGISDHILSEIIKIMKAENHKHDIPKASILEMIENNPGRMYPHFDYLAELLKIQNYLKLDVLTADNEMLVRFLEKLLISEENSDQEGILQDLDKIVYLFINLEPATIKKQVSQDLLKEIYTKIITTSSSNLLNQFLNKLLIVKDEYKDWTFELDDSLDITTPMQLYLVSKYKLKISTQTNDLKALTNLSKLAKKYGPIVKLSIEENLAFDSIKTVESSVYKNVNLPIKLQSFQELDLFEDFINVYKSFSSDLLKNEEELLANVARFNFINKGEKLTSNQQNELLEFEKFYQDCYEIIQDSKKTSLSNFTNENSKFLEIVGQSRNLRLKTIRLVILTYPFTENNEQMLDLVVNLFNKNIESSLGTEEAYKLIEAFIFTVLVNKNLDLANYIKEGFVKNETLKPVDLKKLNKYFVRYGDLIELEKTSDDKNIFMDTMKNIVLNEFVKNI